MIRTATQLKAKVRNLSGSDSRKAQTLIRNFVMERFLERVALSRYRSRFILKGGMLVASVVGLDARATMDIDASLSAYTLSKENAVRLIEEIMGTELSDGLRFQITKVTDIMEENDYPGIRFTLEAELDHLRQSIKIDISTGDIITPGAVEYSYPLMFEDRSIALLTYNLETLLAEKLETIMSRGAANTRMRDFYDIYVIGKQQAFDADILRAAFMATSEKRGSLGHLPGLNAALRELEADEAMLRLWNNYRDESFFVGELSWKETMQAVERLAAQVVEPA